MRLGPSLALTGQRWRGGAANPLAAYTFEGAAPETVIDFREGTYLGLATSVEDVDIGVTAIGTVIDEDENEKYRAHNHINYPDDLTSIGNSEWGALNVTPTANGDGSFRLTATGDGYFEQGTVGFVPAVGIYGIKFRAKAAASNFVRLFVGTPGSCWFDLGTGSVGTDDFGTATMTLRSDGYYDCYVEVSDPTQFRIMLSDADGSAVETSGNSIDIKEPHFFTIGSLGMQNNPDTGDSYVGGAGAGTHWAVGYDYAEGSRRLLVESSNSDTLVIPAAVLPYDSSGVWFTISGSAARQASTLLTWQVDGTHRIYIAMTTGGTFTLYLQNGGSVASVGTTAKLPDTDMFNFSLSCRISPTEINIGFGGDVETADASGFALPNLSSSNMIIGGDVWIDTITVGTGAPDDAWNAAASEDMRVTHVIPALGQSNQIGRATFDGGTTHPAKTYMWNNGSNKLVPVAYPLDHVNEIAGDMGPDITFSQDYMAANPDINLALVGYAQGGTAFFTNNWNDGDTLHEAAVSEINTALSLIPRRQLIGMLWVQGETDAENGVTEAQYADYIDAMIAAFRGSITGASSMPFVAGQIGTFLDTGTYSTRDGINAAIADLPNRVSNSAYASSVGLNDDGDLLHYGGSDLRTLGTRLNTALASLL